MNMPPNTRHPHDPGDDRFDDAMRALHRASLAQVSPAVRWKLRPSAARPQAGVVGRFAGMPNHRWRVGTAFAGVAASVFALALGVSLWRADVGPAATTTAPAVVAADTATTVIDQDPDFYTWLASDDADLLAME